MQAVADESHIIMGAFVEDVWSMFGPVNAFKDWNPMAFSQLLKKVCRREPIAVCSSNLHSTGLWATILVPYVKVKSRHCRCVTRILYGNAHCHDPHPLSEMISDIPGPARVRASRTFLLSPVPGNSRKRARTRRRRSPIPLFPTVSLRRFKRRVNSFP